MLQNYLPSINKPTILAICGAAGAGKNTVGEIVSELYPNSGIFSFASNIKHSAYVLNPWIRVPRIHKFFGYKFYRLQTLVDKYGWDVVKRRYPEVRTFLQILGTEAGHEIHGQDCWVKPIVKTIINKWETLGNSYLPIITDLRMTHEPELLETCMADGIKRNVIVWRIEGRKEILGLSAKKHKSETQNPKHDVVIRNAGTLEDLRTIVKFSLISLNSSQEE